MIYPNNYYTYQGWGYLRLVGLPTEQTYNPQTGLKRGMFVGESEDYWLQTTSIPAGGAPHAAYVWPYVAGGMSAANSTDTVASLTGTAALIRGGPMSGTGSMSFTSTGANLRLTVGLAGTSTITMSSTGANLRLTIGLSGTGSWTFTGTSSLAMIVPFSGTGTVATITGTSDLKGLLSLKGSWTPFTELSPENLANAVWQYLIEGNYTAEQAMRLLTAVAAGTTTIVDLGGGLAEVTFDGIDGTPNRVVADMTNSERTSVTLDLD
jgi:hypothetical protein